MEAFPHIDTIKYYCTDPTQLYPQSHMLDFHNKADGHERRIATYLVENFRTKIDLEVCTWSLFVMIWSCVVMKWTLIRQPANIIEYSLSFTLHSCLKLKPLCLATEGGDVNGVRIGFVVVLSSGNLTIAGL
jgi:hypothetical protein